MRAKLAVLEQALTGHFDDHHGLLCQLMLQRIDAVTATIDQVTTQINRLTTPYAHQVAQLDAIIGSAWSPPGAARRARVEMGRFPSAAHLVSWAKFAPIDQQSAATNKRGSTGRGNPWLAATVGEIVAVGNSVLTIVWQLLADPQAHYQDLGPDFYCPRSTSDAANVTWSASSSTSPASRSSSNPHPEYPAA
jgi:transposase